MKRVLWCAYALAIGYASHILAAEIAPGTTYTGPTTLDVRQLGLSFTLPQGWVGTLQGEAFLVGSHTIDGLGMLSADKMTVDDAKRWYLECAGPLDWPWIYWSDCGILAHGVYDPASGSAISPRCLRCEHDTCGN